MCCERLRPGRPPARRHCRSDQWRNNDDPRPAGAEAWNLRRGVCGGVRDFAERRFRGRSALNAPDRVCGAIPRSLKDEPAFGRSPRSKSGASLPLRGITGWDLGEAR